MKRNASCAAPAVVFDEWQEEADRNDLKEVAFPDDLLGNVERSVRLRFVFQDAGYVVRLVERSDQHPTVWIIRLRDEHGPILSGQQFMHRVLQLLHKIDIPVRKGDIVTQKTGNRILVSFILPPTAAARQKKAKQSQFLPNIVDRPH